MLWISKHINFILKFSAMLLNWLYVITILGRKLTSQKQISQKFENNKHEMDVYRVSKYS